MNYINTSMLMLFIIIFISLFFTATSKQFKNCKCDSNLPFYRIHPKPSMIIVTLAFVTAFALLITQIATPNDTTTIKDWEIALILGLGVVGTLILTKYPLTLAIEKLDAQKA